VLRKTLWGDYYVNTKAKKILKGAQVGSVKIFLKVASFGRCYGE